MGEIFDWAYRNQRCPGGRFSASAAKTGRPSTQSPKSKSTTVRVLWGFDAGVPLFARRHPTLSRQSQRPSPQPNRSPYTSSRRRLQRAMQPVRRQIPRQNPHSSGISAPGAARSWLLQITNPRAQLRTICALVDTGKRTLEMSMPRMNLAARAHDRQLRVARTIADLDHSHNVAALTECIAVFWVRFSVVDRLV